MRSNTIRYLNKLNQEFYRQVASSFNQTRQHGWQGWTQLLPLLKNTNNLKILDIGCGNARFANFLLKNNIKVELYTGLDQDEKLLEFAQSNLDKLNIPYHLEQIDIITILEEKDESFLSKYDFNAIVVFGVLHHIPSFELRKSLIKNVTNISFFTHFIVFTLWKFHEFHYFHNKLINPKILNSKNFDTSDLEHNDFFLNWQNNNHFIRYCHFIDNVEEIKLFTNLDKPVKKTFRADGKKTKSDILGSTNQYIIL